MSMPDARPLAVAGRVRTAHVLRVIKETPDAHSLVLRLDGPEVTYQPGQFLTIRVPSERTGSVARCYSLASSPHGTEDMTVTVKRTPGGYGSNWLLDHAAPGTAFDVLLPAGTFTPRSLDVDLLLLAGGSGITPIMSIAKSALLRGSGHVALVYANRDTDSVIFARELAELSATHPSRLTVIHWLEALLGLPSVEQLQTLVQPYFDREVFVCGPAPFMNAVSAAARGKGVPPTRLHLEIYNSLRGDPFTEVEALTPDDGAVAQCEARVELDGAVHELRWPADRTLVDVLLANGIEAPYSCREGECGACACTVTQGQVNMLRSDALDPEDVAAGIVLGCQARPGSPMVTIVF